jgi:hypothetical protein
MRKNNFKIQKIGTIIIKRNYYFLRMSFNLHKPLKKMVLNLILKIGWTNLWIRTRAMNKITSKRIIQADLINFQK